MASNAVRCVRCLVPKSSHAVGFVENSAYCLYSAQPFDAPPEGRALDVNIKEEGGESRSAVHVAAFHGAEAST